MSRAAAAWQAQCAAAECRDTVLRAARLADARDAAGMAGLFTADAELQRPDGTRLRGRDAIEAAYAKRPADTISRHLLMGSLVELDAPDRARVSTQLLLWRGSSHDPTGTLGRPLRGPQVLGTFEDLLVRDIQGCWRIAHRVARFELHGDDGA